MNDGRQQTNCSARQTRSGLARQAVVVGHLCVHLTGIAIVAAALAWMAIGLDHIRWMASVHQISGETSYFLSEVVVHGLLSAATWTLIYLTFSAVMDGRSDGRRVLKKARGTVITETIIILPVLLILILGLSQLVINNLAGMLLNYGSSQAARTVWVWSPETEPIEGGPGPRMGVDDERVQEMARLQVAAAMTPVAPSVFASRREIDSPEFEQMRAILLASQIPGAPNDAGNIALDRAQGFDDFEAADSLTFVNALDGSNYAARTVRKFSSAYNAVELEVVREDGQVGVEMTYFHQITFPLVGAIFGETGSVEGARGYFMPLRRQIFYSAQVPPNATMPRR